jgi:hypothetical protein
MTKTGPFQFGIILIILISTMLLGALAWRLYRIRHVRKLQMRSAPKVKAKASKIGFVTWMEVNGQPTELQRKTSTSTTSSQGSTVTMPKKAFVVDKEGLVPIDEKV